MSKKDVELFFEETSKNEALRKDLAKAEESLTSLDKSEMETFFKEKLLPLAKDYGFDFSYQDVLDYKQSLTPKDGEELSDDFLNQVSGGAGSGCVIIGAGKSGCGCFIGGSGEKSSGKGICACVVIGAST